MYLAGKIGKPHGLDGEVFVLRVSDDPHRFDPGSSLQHENGSTLVVVETRVHGDRFLVRFEGIGSRENAERIRGDLFVSAEMRRDLGDGEYWIEDLKGATAVGADGEIIGTVTDVISGAAQDLIELATENGSRLVPLVPAIVTSVDIEERKVVIDPPEGLLD